MIIKKHGSNIRPCFFIGKNFNFVTLKSLSGFRIIDVIERYKK